MSEKVEKKYFKGREIISPEEWPEEVKENDKKQLEKERTYTIEVKEKYQKELKELTEVAKKYGFSEILISEVAEKPRATLFFPQEIGNRRITIFRKI